MRHSKSRCVDISISHILSGNSSNFLLDISTNSNEDSKVERRSPRTSMTTQFAKHETEAFSFAFITDNKLFYIIIPSCLAVVTCASCVIVSRSSSIHVTHSKTLCGPSNIVLLSLCRSPMGLTNFLLLWLPQWWYSPQLNVDARRYFIDIFFRWAFSNIVKGFSFLFRMCLCIFVWALIANLRSVESFACEN